MRAPDVAREVDADVADLERREVRRVVVPAAVHEVNERPAARGLIHHRQLDQRMGGGRHLPPRGQKAIDEIGDQAAVRF